MSQFGSPSWHFYLKSVCTPTTLKLIVYLSKLNCHFKSTLLKRFQFTIFFKTCVVLCHIIKIKFSYQFHSLYGGMHDAKLMSHCNQIFEKFFCLGDYLIDLKLPSYSI